MKSIDQLILDFNKLGIKLWVEGDDLCYRAKKGSLTPEMKTEIKERKAELIAFLKRFQEIEQSPFPVNIRPIRQEGSKKPLYFIHVEGEHLFSPFIEYLDREYPIYSISCVGEIMANLLINKIDLYRDLEINVQNLASQYVRELIKVENNEPYCLLGISFGGLVAYEMVQQLTAIGKKVEHLILLDTYNPLNNIEKLRIDKNLLRHIKRFLKLGFYYPRNICKHKIELLKYWFAHQYEKITGKQLFVDLVATLDVIQYHLQLSQDYLPPQYNGNGKISLIQAEDENFYGINALEWQKLTNNQLNIVDTPGTHVGIYEDLINAKTLITKLETLINETS